MLSPAAIDLDSAGEPAYFRAFTSPTEYTYKKTPVPPAPRVLSTKTRRTLRRADALLRRAVYDSLSDPTRARSGLLTPCTCSAAFSLHPTLAPTVVPGLMAACLLQTCCRRLKCMRCSMTCRAWPTHVLRTPKRLSPRPSPQKLRSDICVAYDSSDETTRPPTCTITSFHLSNTLSLRLTATASQVHCRQIAGLRNPQLGMLADARAEYLHAVELFSAVSQLPRMMATGRPGKELGYSYARQRPVHTAWCERPRGPFPQPSTVLPNDFAPFV